MFGLFKSKEKKIIDAVYLDGTSIKSEYRDKLKPTKLSKKL